jgi:hypothetical protein
MRTAKGEGKLATWKPRVVNTPIPIILAMTMMTAEKRVTGLFSSLAPFNPPLSCSINALSTSQPGPSQTNLTPGPNMPGLGLRTPPWVHRFYLNRPAKELIFSWRQAYQTVEAREPPPGLMRDSRGAFAADHKNERNSRPPARPNSTPATNQPILASSLPSAGRLWGQVWVQVWVSPRLPKWDQTGGLMTLIPA